MRSCILQPEPNGVGGGGNGVYGNGVYGSGAVSDGCECGVVVCGSGCEGDVVSSGNRDFVSSG